MEDGRVLFVGLVCLDIIVESDHFPVEDTDQRIPALYYKRGGNASNSSSVMAQFGLPAEFLGNLCDAVELNFIKQDFLDHSVLIHNCPTLTGNQFPTSVVIINLPNGTRTIMHHPRNLPELSWEDFCKISVNDYSWIHFEGRSSNVANISSMVNSITKEMREKHLLKVSVEIEKPRPVLRELLPLGDVVFISKDFAQFSGLQSMEQAVKHFLEFVKPGAIVVCAWGSKGAAAGCNGTIVTQKASSPDQVVDTLGAGDTFNAAFIYSQVVQMDWAKGLEFACLVAGFKVGIKGFKGIDLFKRQALSAVLGTDGEKTKR